MGDWLGSRVIDVEMIDGEKHTVRTIFADAVAYEATARKHGWGSARDTPMQSLSFIVWHALRRLGDIPAADRYEDWAQTLVAVRHQESEERPTGPEPPPG